MFVLALILHIYVLETVCFFGKSKTLTKLQEKECSSYTYYKQCNYGS